MIGRTWRMGHYEPDDEAVIAASGVLPAGAAPVHAAPRSDPDGTERFLFNGTLVQEIIDAGAPNPTVPTHVGFGEFWTTSASSPGPQVQVVHGDRAGTADRATASGPDLAARRTVPGGTHVGHGLGDPRSDRPPHRPDQATRRRPPHRGRLLDHLRHHRRDGGRSALPERCRRSADYNGAGAGLFIYADGWTYDGLGWRDNLGRHAYSDGAVIKAVSNLPPNNAPPGGKPPWAWTPPVDPLTGEPSILTVHFCFYDQWI